MYDYRAKLSDKIRVRGDDGDTILMLIDQGMSRWAEEPIRLAGVTAPESYQLGGIECAQQLRLILDEAVDRALSRRRRWAFMVVTEPNTAPEPSERESFSRYMGHVFTYEDYWGVVTDPTNPDDWTAGKSINAQMTAFLRSHPEWGDGITVPFRRLEHDE